MATSRDLGTFEMQWDCPSCGTTKLLGKTHRYCPSCGAPQAADKRYFPEPGEEVAVEDHVYHGVDWQCPGCDTPTSNAAKFCASCGAPRETDGKAVGKKAVEPPPAVAPPKKSGGGLALFGALGCGGVVLLGLAVLLVNTFWRSEVVLIVADRSWDRTVAVEELREVTEDAWCDEVPASAKVTRRFEAQRGTRQVPDGETCKTAKVDQGDGTFKEVESCTPKTRDEPVMGEKCAYLARKWTVVETLHAAGAETTPSWPDTSTLRGGSGIGARREGAKGETYTVNLRDAVSGDTDTCRLDEARWSTMAKGSRWTTTAGALSGGVDCDALAEVGR